MDLEQHRKRLFVIFGTIAALASIGSLLAHITETTNPYISMVGFFCAGLLSFFTVVNIQKYITNISLKSITSTAFLVYGLGEIISGTVMLFNLRDQVATVDLMTTSITLAVLALACFSIIKESRITSIASPIVHTFNSSIAIYFAFWNLHIGQHFDGTLFHYVQLGTGILAVASAMFIVLSFSELTTLGLFSLSLVAGISAFNNTFHFHNSYTEALSFSNPQNAMINIFFVAILGFIALLLPEPESIESSNYNSGFVEDGISIALYTTIIGSILTIGLKQGLYQSIVVAIWIMTIGVGYAFKNTDYLRTVDKMISLKSKDQLTSLGNRYSLNRYLLQATEAKIDFHVVAFDLKRFKDINNHIGQTAGDEVLRHVAKHAENIADQYSGKAFRLGGDEFIIVAPSDRASTVMITEDMRYQLSTVSEEVPQIASFHLDATFGLAKLNYLLWKEEDIATWKTFFYREDLAPGISESPETEYDPLTGVSHAMVALHSAKQDNQPISWYDKRIENEERRRLRLRKSLEIAIETGQIDTYFQPIIGLQNGLVVGAEALSRWNDPELGPISPVEFIPIAEEAGFIDELGWLLIARCLEFLRDLEPNQTISVNVSPIQLRSPSFVSLLNNLVESKNVDRNRLILEVTEGMFMDLDDPAVANSNKLVREGYHISLDDFGSGWSSWGQMNKLHVSIIKIDRSLVLGMDNEDGFAIVKSIVDMCNALSLKIIAEGIETETIAQMARDIGVTNGQGWLWEKAMSKENFIKFLSTFNGKSLSRPK